MENNLILNHIINEEELIIDIIGRIDSVSAKEFEEYLNENLGEYKNLIINFNNVEYISSAGLRVLLSTMKKLKDGNLIIKEPNEVVKEIFDVTGFSDILNII